MYKMGNHPAIEYHQQQWYVVQNVPIIIIMNVGMVLAQLALRLEQLTFKMNNFPPRRFLRAVIFTLN